MARRNRIEIVINADDQASGKVGAIKGSLGGLKSALGGLGKVAAIGFGAVAAGATAAAAGIVKLAMDAAKLEPVERDFGRLSESIGETTDAMLTGMREASYGMVADADLMQSANRLISMGLADSAKEAAGLTRMAVRLGEAMGKGPTAAMEEFALMMANQSIPRLDTFGISAGQVRERMAELMQSTKKGGYTQAQLTGAMGKSSQAIADLQRKIGIADMRMGEWTDKTKESTKASQQMAREKLLRRLAEEEAKLGKLASTTATVTSATKALTREEAFAQAVAELGAESLERVGEGGVGAAASMARLQATMTNLKNTAGKAFVPVLAAILEPLGQLAEKHGPRVIEWAQQLAGWLELKAIPAVKSFGKDVSGWLGKRVPVAMAAVSGFWATTLQPALAAFSQYWTETLHPALKTAVAWLGENIPVAMAAVSNFWTGTLQPALAILARYWTETLQPALRTAQEWLGEKIPEAFDTIVSFVKKHTMPVLAGLGAAILTIIVPAFVVWAAGALAAGVATLTALLPILVPVLAIGLAVGALALAWETNFLNIQGVTGNVVTAVKGFWEETLQPALETAAAWLGEKIPIAMEAISTFWTETLQPALETAAVWLGENIPVAMQAISDFWIETLRPALEAIWGFIVTDLKPAVMAVSRVIKELVRIAFEALYIIITEKVLPELKKVWKWLKEKLEPASETLKGVIDPLNTALETLKGWLADIAEMAGRAAEALAKVQPSEWFKTGSPTPFEKGLRGIARAAREATAAIGSMSAQPGGFGGMGMAGAGAGAGGQRIIVLAPIMVDPRQAQNVRGDWDYRTLAELLLDMEKGL